MKALVFLGHGEHCLEDRPKPTIRTPDDAIVRMTKTTICGTDLHILKGDVPTCAPGRILGHEGIGVIEETGAAVHAFHPGDRVLISCITSCGTCEYCRRGMYSHCVSGGWILGNQVDGTQAEFVRIPHANTSLYRLPADLHDDAAVLLSDILPTGFECGVLNGKIEPGCSVAIVGAGPIGLATLLTARLYSPATIIVIDPDQNRLKVARCLGATETICASGGDASERVLRLTGGRGVDAAIEAVGIPDSFLICEDIVAPGGCIANIGVHGAKVDLHLERLWARNITIKTGLVDTSTLPMLLKLLSAGRIDPMPLITHQFRFDQVLEAYRVFSHASCTRALKVLIGA
jgi:alcohol dehydrogenase